MITILDIEIKNEPERTDSFRYLQYNLLHYLRLKKIKLNHRINFIFNDTAEPFSVIKIIGKNESICYVYCACNTANNDLIIQATMNGLAMLTESDITTSRLLSEIERDLLARTFPAVTWFKPKNIKSKNSKVSVNYVHLENYIEFSFCLFDKSSKKTLYFPFFKAQQNLYIIGQLFRYFSIEGEMAVIEDMCKEIKFCFDLSSRQVKVMFNPSIHNSKHLENYISAFDYKSSTSFTAGMLSKHAMY